MLISLVTLSATVSSIFEAASFQILNNN